MDIQLKGLEGIKRKIVKAKEFNTVTSGMTALLTSRAATTADDNGAINIWIEDSGLYRGCRYKYLIEQSYVISDTKTKLKEWLTNELAKIR